MTVNVVLDVGNCACLVGIGIHKNEDVFVVLRCIRKRLKDMYGKKVEGPSC